jgi:hypothetical protein
MANDVPAEIAKKDVSHGHNGEIMSISTNAVDHSIVTSVIKEIEDNVNNMIDEVDNLTKKLSVADASDSRNGHVPKENTVSDDVKITAESVGEMADFTVANGFTEGVENPETNEVMDIDEAPADQGPPAIRSYRDMLKSGVKESTPAAKPTPSNDVKVRRSGANVKPTQPPVVGAVNGAASRPEPKSESSAKLNNSVFVKSLPDDTTVEELKAAFSRFGTVVGIDLNAKVIFLISVIKSLT